MRKLVGVVDETSSSSRPLEADNIGFGVGVILFEEKALQGFATASSIISRETGTADFKYKQFSAMDLLARPSFRR